MATAFVLSGGGSLGSVQVGMLQALAEREIQPDLIVGTSVGAVNGAYVAGHPGPEGAAALAEVWLSIRRRDVFPVSALSGLLGMAGRRRHLVSPVGLERLLHTHIRFDRLEDALIPLHLTATEVTSGLEVVLSSGDAVKAVMASAAIPGVFPPVAVDGHLLMDGGVANNTPLSHAVDLGAEVVYVLPAGYACGLPAPPATALGMALHALTVMLEQRLHVDISRYENAVDLRVMPPLCPLGVSAADFGHSRELIDRARRSTGDWLDRVDPAARMNLARGVHRHDPPRG